MARRKTSAASVAKVARALAYERADQLREFGYAVKFGTKKKGAGSSASMAAVTRVWGKVKKFVDNEKQTFVFVETTEDNRANYETGLSSKVFTPGGFFYRIPKNSKKPKLRVNDDGVITVKYSGKKGGRLTEEIHHIDPELLMEDPPKAIQALAKKKDRIVLTVNGWDSSTTREYSLDALAFYIAEDLLPKFLDPNIRKNDPRYAREHGKGPRTVEDFVDVFHIKILRHEKPPRRKNRKIKHKRKKAVQPRKRGR